MSDADVATMSDEEFSQLLASALVDEYAAVETLRKEVLVDLIAICRAVQNLQKKLGDENLALLTKGAWEEADGRKHLTEAVVCMMRCMKTIETGHEVQRPRYSMDPPKEEM